MPGTVDPLGSTSRVALRSAAAAVPSQRSAAEMPQSVDTARNAANLVNRFASLLSIREREGICSSIDCGLWGSGEAPGDCQAWFNWRGVAVPSAALALPQASRRWSSGPTCTR